MKKILLLLTLPTIFIFSECNKYEEGPMLSLRTKKQRLMNSWVIDEVFETPSGGSKTDKTADYKNYYYNYNMIISDNDVYGVTYKILNLLPYSETGTWTFASKKESVIFTNSDPNQSTAIGAIWRILRLKDDEYWAVTTGSNGTAIEAHFKQQ